MASAAPAAQQSGGAPHSVAVKDSAGSLLGSFAVAPDCRLQEIYVRAGKAYDAPNQIIRLALGDRVLENRREFVSAVLQPPPTENVLVLTVCFDSIRNQLAERDHLDRSNACGTLGTLRSGISAEAVVLLTNACKDPVEFVRQEALAGVTKLSLQASPGAKAEALDVLRAALHDEIESVRCAAASGLWALTDPDSADASHLPAALGNSDPTARVCAVKALQQVGEKADWPGALALLRPLLGDESAIVRCAVAFAIRFVSSSSNQEAKNMLSVAMRDLDPKVRKEAATGVRVLGRPADEAALPQLLSMLDDENLEVRCEVALAIGIVGMPGQAEALGAMLVALQDPETLLRISAVRSLACLVTAGDAEAVAALRGRLADKHEFIRKTASDILRKIGGESEV